VIGAARIQGGHYPALQRDTWYPVVDRNPEAIRPEALEGYVWLEAEGRGIQIIESGDPLFVSSGFFAPSTLHSLTADPMAGLRHDSASVYKTLVIRLPVVPEKDLQQELL
jgi:hypothetical protein